MNRRQLLSLSGGVVSLLWVPSAWSADTALTKSCGDFGVKDGGVRVRIHWDLKSSFGGTAYYAGHENNGFLFDSAPQYLGEAGLEKDNGVATSRLDANNNSQLRIRVLFTDRRPVLPGDPRIFVDAGDVITAYRPPGANGGYGTEGSWSHVGKLSLAPNC